MGVSLVGVLHVVRVVLDHIVHASDLFVEIFEVLLDQTALVLSLALVKSGQVFKMLNACTDVDHGTG
jgi:hypothetical protein